MIENPTDGPEPPALTRLSLGDICAYQISDQPKYLLAVCVAKGRKRPGLYVWEQGTNQMRQLAAFNGLEQAALVVEWLDDFAGQLGRCIRAFNEKQQPDTPPTDPPSP